MCHLQSCFLEATFDVESLICLTAVKNALVAADLARNVIESLNKLFAELLPLLIFCNGDVLDVTDKTEMVDELSLHDQGSGPHNPRSVIDNEEIIRALALCAQPLVSFIALLISDISDCCEDTQTIQKAILEIAAS